MKYGAKKWLVFFVLILVMGTVLAACNSGGQQSSSETSSSNGNTKEKSGKQKGSPEMADKQVLDLYSPAGFTSLDPQHAQDEPSFDALYQLRAGLVSLDQDGKVVPDMAKTMPKMNKDKTVYTFKLRDDIKWSNGDPVTAQDFVYAWHRELNPKTAAEYAYIYGAAHIKNADKIMDKKSGMYGKVDKLGIKALDKKTVQITLDKPTPFFISLMTFPPFLPLHQSFVEKQGDKFATSPNRMLFNGAFKLTNWQRDESWQYQKNDKYWNAEKVKLQKVNFKVVKETSTVVNLYKTNKTAYAELTSEYIGQFKNSGELHKELTSQINFIRLNEKNKALANKKIRKALYNSFNRKKMTNYLLKDGSSPARYDVPKDFAKGPDGKDFRATNPKVNQMSVKEARSVWKKGLKEIGKDQLTLRLLFHEGTQAEKVATYLKSQMEKNLPGLKVRINKQPYNQHLKLEANQDYDMSMWGWLPDYRDPMTYLDMWESDASMSHTGYDNPKYDKLIEKAKNLGAQPKKRWETMQEAEKMLLDDAAIIPTYQFAKVYLVKPYVKNLLIRNYGSSLDFKYAYITKHEG